MRVEVRPLPHKKWHGKKDGESFSQPKVVEALYDEEIGGYATGLTKEEEKEYGDKLGVNLSNIYNPEGAHPYYSLKAAWAYLPNHTIIFDDTKTVEAIKIKMLRASKRVANSMQEWEENKWPDATHVIFDEAQEVALKATKIARKRRAVEFVSKLSPASKIDIVMVLSNKSVKNQGIDFIEVELDDIVENMTEELLELQEMGRPEIMVRSQITEMVQRNIITKEGGAFYYMGEMIGMDFEGTVSYFKDPNNQQVKTLMINKLDKI